MENQQTGPLTPAPVSKSHIPAQPHWEMFWAKEYGDWTPKGLQNEFHVHQPEPGENGLTEGAGFRGEGVGS